MKIKGMKRIQDDEIGMDALEVEYEVDGQLKKMFFTNYDDAVRNNNGTYNFKHKILEFEKEQSKKSMKVRRRVKKLNISEFGGDKIEIQN
ncbi:hypothetical protein DRQ25_15700 [Candidatus Fermentibacteria bacterium]|nr:MAG: hypothetical protein DRQ25_15700 [Candidatus Fermentibacteria bacterium]